MNPKQEGSLVKYPSKLRPTRRIPPGECPCGAPAIGSMWEADLGLCYVHVRDWLGSSEKRGIMKVPGVFKEAVTGTELPLGEVVSVDDAAVLRAVDAFVERIRRKTWWERIQGVICFYWDLAFPPRSRR